MKEAGLAPTRRSPNLWISRFGSPLVLSRVHWVRPELDLKALLLRENQATFSREGPTVRIPFAPGGSQLRTSLPLAQMLDGSLTFDGYLGRSLAHPNRSSRLRRRVIASSPRRRIYLCHQRLPKRPAAGPSFVYQLKRPASGLSPPGEQDEHRIAIAAACRRFRPQLFALGVRSILLTAQFLHARTDRREIVCGAWSVHVSSFNGSDLDVGLVDPP